MANNCFILGKDKEAFPVAALYGEVASVASEDSHTAGQFPGLHRSRVLYILANQSGFPDCYTPAARNIKLLLWFLTWCLDGSSKVVPHW
ncbi:hypothetical protein T11_9139 [Trichinella zimbabwensis]|uniref:Uncharacterized protein n=1 Tax=Trichinella zimbabwensis TaxID=268475 RepID=A0A0V1H6B3_9BILA|nr:hypothetical protein T11_9139 [Trichinella zimbabwensis]